MSSFNFPIYWVFFWISFLLISFLPLFSTYHYNFVYIPWFCQVKVWRILSCRDRTHFKGITWNSTRCKSFGKRFVLLVWVWAKSSCCRVLLSALVIAVMAFISLVVITNQMFLEKFAVLFSFSLFIYLSLFFLNTELRNRGFCWSLGF